MYLKKNKTSKYNISNLKGSAIESSLKQADQTGHAELQFFHTMTFTCQLWHKIQHNYCWQFQIVSFKVTWKWTDKKFIQKKKREKKKRSRQGIFAGSKGYETLFLD